ncbi:sensor histidine kinase [Pedobacter sp. ASV28]|uniref:sensor histidine kinase n=1 Tax=Pedobacter sp. ASV28 TaxID=2795123 RepID=UPI0018EAB97F|nr:histidine kinase [Pedobacter sp. ASV28]
MEQHTCTFKEGNWVYRNVKYTIIGLLVGLALSAIIGVLNSNGISWRGIFGNILFSLFITLSISNVVALFQHYSNIASTNFWKFILSFYICNLIGMVLGIEISYFIISILFDVKYQIFYHKQDYKSISVIVMVVGTIVLLYHLQKRNAENLLKAKETDLLKLQQLKTQAELQALQSKINPHFLYNALNSIVSLIHEDPDKAEDMTIKLSKLFRYSINSQQENFCTLKEEIEILNTYLVIEKVRFGNRIRFDMEIDSSLDHLLFPRFLLQPLVENALKHGLKDTYENGLMKVVIRKTDKKLEILIHDNGAPFPEELVAGYGLQSTFDKLQLLYGNGYDIQLINTSEKQIKISIPAN